MYFEKKMNIIRTVSVLAVLMSIGCGSIDIADYTSEIKLSSSYKYRYFIQNNIGSNEFLCVVYPGISGGYEQDISVNLIKYIKNHDISAEVIIPDIEYKNKSTGSDFYNQTTIELIKKLSYRKLLFFGQSAGSLQILKMSNMIKPEKILVLITGANIKEGGTPETVLDQPADDVDIWFLNCYNKDILSKYNIYMDDVVYVNPTINLFDFIKDSGDDIKMSLFEGYTHSSFPKKLNYDKYFEWIFD